MSKVAVPATVDTVFAIGSDTKQFTAAAILQLRDQGKLSLDDDIDGAAAGLLPWVEAWTFRHNQAHLTFRRSASGGPTTELRFDRVGGHVILKRQ